MEHQSSNKNKSKNGTAFEKEFTDATGITKIRKKTSLGLRIHTGYHRLLILISSPQLMRLWYVLTFQLLLEVTD